MCVHNTDYNIARGPTLRDSGLETHIGLARFVHYGEVAGIRGGVQVFPGFGSLQDARIGAQNLTLSAFLWPSIRHGPDRPATGLRRAVQPRPLLRCTILRRQRSGLSGKQPAEPGNDAPAPGLGELVLGPVPQHVGSAIRVSGAATSGSTESCRTEIQRIRVHTGYFIDPTLQVGLELNQDLRAVGGFKQDSGAVLRVLKAF